MLLLWTFIALVLGIGGSSIYLFFKHRSQFTAIAGATGTLGILSLLVFMQQWSRTPLASVILTLLISALILFSLVCNTITRNRGRRGVVVWVRYLLFPVLAVPLLLASLIAFMEFLH